MIIRVHVLKVHTPASPVRYAHTSLCTQILSFVSRLYFSCCGDYFEELISLSTGGQQRGGQPADLPEKQKHVTPVVPGWGDMMSVVRGYVDLYKMRVFFVLKVRGSYFCCVSVSNAESVGRRTTPSAAVVIYGVCRTASVHVGVLVLSKVDGCGGFLDRFY